MQNITEAYWQLRINRVKQALELNNFEVFTANEVNQLKDLLQNKIIPSINAKSVGWGGSLTLSSMGLIEYLKDKKDIECFDPFEKGLSSDESLEVRKQCLTADLFMSGTNAVTESGKLVNLDMTGNRVSGICFGPKNVLIVLGRNKIVKNIDDAITRIKSYAAPTNAMRLNKNTPCVKTGTCEDCHKIDRICNIWSIVEKAYPKGRIKIVLINKELGL